jgi:hypothetical protein
LSPTLTLPARSFSRLPAVFGVSYKICLSANSKEMTLGLVALGIWILNLGGMLLVDFHHAVTGFLFWASAAVLLLLVTAVALSDTPSDARRASSRSGLGTEAEK